MPFLPQVVFLLTALPVLGAILVLATARYGLARQMALTNVLVTFALSVVLVCQYDPQRAGDAQRPLDDPTLQMVTDIPWLAAAQAGPGSVSGSGPDVRFALGVDGLSLWMIVLSALLMIPAVLVSWEAVRENVAGFYALMLVLESGMIGVFAAQDLVLFYIFFEFTLIPLFFMIGWWGGSDRRNAAKKFFIYTLAGSLLTLLGLIGIVLSHSWMTGWERVTFSIPALTAEIGQFVTTNPAHHNYWTAMAPLLFLALFAGFAIKVPLFPFHTWLPLAHVEAPTAGSVLLAGVLLKIGSYGFVRFGLLMTPTACWAAAGWVGLLSVIGIVYGALLALGQDDIKKLVAYSSVSHMGFCMLGLFALNTLGVTGGMLQMINHGLSTGALFALVGMLYERYHTREIQAFGGLARKFPRLAFFFVLVSFSSIGLPGTNGFTGEFLVLAGSFLAQPLYAVLGLSGIILGAWYMLWLVKRVFYGRLREPITAHGAGHAQHGTPGSASAPVTVQLTTPASSGHASGGHGDAHGHGGHGHSGHGHAAHAVADHDPHGLPDLNLRELMALTVVVVPIIWIGLFPSFFIHRMQPSIDRVVKRLEASRPRLAEGKSADSATVVRTSTTGPATK